MGSIDYTIARIFETLNILNGSSKFETKVYSFMHRYATSISISQNNSKHGINKYKKLPLALALHRLIYLIHIRV